MLNNIIEQWLGEESNKMTVFVENNQKIELKEIDIRGYNLAIETLKSRIPELEEMITKQIYSSEILKIGEFFMNEEALKQLIRYQIKKGVEDIINPLKGDKE